MSTPTPQTPADVLTWLLDQVSLIDSYAGTSPGTWENLAREAAAKSRAALRAPARPGEARWPQAEIDTLRQWISETGHHHAVYALKSLEAIEKAMRRVAQPVEAPAAGKCTCEDAEHDDPFCPTHGRHPLKVPATPPEAAPTDRGGLAEAARLAVPELRCMYSQLTGKSIDEATGGSVKRAVDALSSALAAPADAAGQAGRWVPVTPETMPEPELPVLACSVHEGKRRPAIRACWVPRFTVEDNGCYQGDAEYHEERDRYYWPEGWYEWNEHEDTHWRVSSAPVTHWQPLPPALTPTPRQEER